MNSLEVLLKKCPNITSIQLNQAYEGKCDYNEVFPLIIKYCNNLREIDLHGNEINNKNIKELHRKIGQKIKSLDHLKDANNYKLFPNIEKLNAYFDCGLKRVLSQLKLKHLTDLMITLNSGEEHMVKTCVDTFPTLTHFNLIYCDNLDSIYSSLDYISNLKHLKYFGFKFFGQNNKLFCDSLKQISNKCHKIKSIECKFEINSENSLNTQLFSTFVAFPSLKRLRLKFYFDFNVNLDINELFPFEAFKYLSNITHLTLQFSHYFSFKFFKDIDINLLKLQYLEIDAEIKANPEEVTQMADILSRLSRLQTLKLVFNKEVNYEEIEVKVREKCRKIRTIDIKHKKLFY